MSKVAELIGVTLGPKGRNVVLQNKYGPPKIVNDGETVLKEVIFLILFGVMFDNFVAYQVFVEMLQSDFYYY